MTNSPDGQRQEGSAGGPISASIGYVAGDVPCPQEEPTPLSELTCTQPNWGGNCHAACLAYGALCSSVVDNYITNRQNVLWKCCNCNPGKCWYIDRADPKSGCVSPSGVDKSPLCWAK